MTIDMAQTLRDAIIQSRLSANRISADTGVSQPTISRFLSGADMHLHSASIIAGYLGLKLIKTRKRK